jgi:hypothetical protein
MMRTRTARVALVLAIALVGAACARGPNDGQIATSIKARMFSDPQLRGAALNVAVKNGVATVSGQVPSVAERYEAFRVATDTPGVKKVNDQMTILEPDLSSKKQASQPLAPAPPQQHSVVRHHHVAQAAPPPRQAHPAPLPGYPDYTTPATQPAENNQGPMAPPATTPAPAPTLTPEQAAAPAIPAPPATERITIPQGTKVNVQMIDSISSAVNRTGDIFHASLASPLVVNHQVVAPKGTNVYLQLVEAKSAGHLAGQSVLRVELYRLRLDGRSYPLVSNDYVVKGASRSKRSLLAIIGGAALGAVVGAAAGGGKGAAIGAAAGGGGGVAYEGMTKAKQVQISSEQMLHFKLAQPVDVKILAPATGPAGSGPSAKR